MIVTDTGAFSEVTPLDVIRRAIAYWHYPWQLEAGPPQKQEERSAQPPPSVPTQQAAKVGDSITTATLIAEETTVRGSIGAGQDRYFFQFKASSPKTRVILRKLAARGFRAAVDVYDYVENRVAGQTEVGVLLGPMDRPISLAFESKPGEIYYIEVKLFESSVRGDYELTVRKE